MINASSEVPAENPGQQPSGNREPAGLFVALRPLRLVVAVGWIAGLLSYAFLLVERQLRVIHPLSIPFLILVAVVFGAAILALGCCLRQLWRGPHRLRAIAWVAFGFLPPLSWIALGWYGQSQWATRSVPHNLPFALLRLTAASVMEAEVGWLYPHRLETDRLVMFYGDRVANPQADIESMDRHVQAMEKETGLPLRAKIWWVRGSLLGQQGVAFCGLALGSSNSPAEYVDRHELAHAVMSQAGYPDTEPPTFLSEGWADARSLDGETLATNATSYRSYVAEMGGRWDAMTKGPEGAKFLADFFQTAPDPEGTSRLYAKVRDEGKVGSYLREMADPFWYHHDAGAVYKIGGPFVDFLIRHHGPERFVKLYFQAQPSTFAHDLETIYGTSLDTLEAQFWEDVEKRARKP